MGLNIDEYKCQMIEMADFYINLPNSTNLESDIYSINIAKTSALKITELLDKNEKDLDRKAIIELESCMMSLIHGVEQFNDLTIQVEHQKYSKLRYEFLEYIDPFL